MRRKSSPSLRALRWQPSQPFFGTRAGLSVSGNRLPPACAAHRSERDATQRWSPSSVMLPPRQRRARFGQQACVVLSGQLHAEALACSLGKVRSLRRPRVASSRLRVDESADRCCAAKIHYSCLLTCRRLTARCTHSARPFAPRTGERRPRPPPCSQPARVGCDALVPPLAIAAAGCAVVSGCTCFGRWFAVCTSFQILPDHFHCAHCQLSRLAQASAVPCALLRRARLSRSDRTTRYREAWFGSHAALLGTATRLGTWPSFGWSSPS